MSDAKIGSFDDLLEITTADLKPIMIALQDLVLSIDPKPCIVVRLGDRAATYGVGPKKMSEGYCYLLPHTKWVNLGFFKGAYLPDPSNLLEGTGANMRHVKIRSVDECSNPDLIPLIMNALAERKAALGIS